MKQEKKYIKIHVKTDENDWHGMTAENLWGHPVSDTVFRIENNPLYAYGISYHDAVHCSPMNDGRFKFENVVIQGGHSNYRILLRAGRTREDFLRVWPELESLGCAYESNKDPEDVFAIDVPPDTDVHAVFDILDKGEKDQVWHLDEGNFEHSQQIK